MEKKHILMIVGSMRAASFNRQLAQIAAEMLGQRAEVSFLEYADIPYMNQDIEFPAPAAVAQVREAVLAADGIWIVSPEYNHSIPGVLKNLLDWLSRPLADGGAPVSAGKAVTFCGAGGVSGTACVQDQLLFLLNFMGMHVVNIPRAVVALTGKEFQTNELELSEISQGFLKKQAEAFLDSLE